MDIYFMTGTGNSFWAANQLEELTASDGYDSRIIPIDGLKKKDIRRGGKEDLFGFIYPTHGFSLPWYMLKFVLRFPRGRGKVFLVNNRAGMKMGKVYTPGISGIAVLLPMLILFIKGYRIVATLPLDTPSNWISVHPGLRPKIIKSVFERREKDIFRLWNNLKNNRLFYPFKFFIFLPIDILLIKISLAYMFFGRFMLARSYIADEKCDGCGICSSRCPVNAIRMKGGKPFWTHKCESCMRCSNVCPKRSVNSSIPLMILYTWGIMKIGGVNGLLEPYIWKWISKLEGIAAEIITYLVLWILTLILVFIMYRIVFLLCRLKIFNRLFTFSTPMKYWRHYLAPGFNGKY